MINILDGGKLLSQTPAIKEKISKAVTGKNNFMFGKFGNKHHFFGEHHTMETRKKISSHKRKLTKEQIELIKLDTRSQSKIDKDYSICQQLVSLIKNGKRNYL